MSNQEERMKFAVTLAREFDMEAGQATQDALRLIRLARSHKRYCEAECNGEGAKFDEEGRAIAKPKVEQRIRAVISAMSDGTDKADVKFSGDPRGATVKLILPSGKTNDWGNDGWYVPTN